MPKPKLKPLTFSFNSSLALAGLLALSCGLSACSSSSFRDRNSDYHQAEKVENPLAAKFDEQDAMPVEDVVSRPKKAQKNAPRPEPLRVASADELIVKREDAKGSWLLVMRSPGQVWASMRAFAETQNPPIESLNPRLGELQLEADSSQQLPAQKFTLRQGVRRGSSEIHINSYQELKRLSWSSYDAERLESLAAFLKESLLQEGAGISLQAQALPDQRLVRLVDRDERQVLEFSLNYERAWSELLNLLEDEFNKPEQQLEDYDRAAGRIYFSYVPPSQRPQGFWSRLFSRKKKPQNYQLVMQDYTNNQDVILETSPGQAAPAAIEQELLTWLERQLR